ncbi:MAG: hypothetical protein LQ338_003379 [Usnochroma carphineum]|nr:MAG: hypothetical protein LQ338_003379 [Usnochroma carphineum]
MSLGSVILRPQQRIPEHVEGQVTISIDHDHLVEFKHPAYPGECDTFLVVSALDHPSGGLHYDTAKVACGIIAGNNWEGYFTAEKNGPPIPLKGDDILPRGKWYFYLPSYPYDSIDASYPITPNFSQWKFPHHNLPENWQLPPEVPRRNPHKARSNASLAVAVKDGDQCRVSGRKEQCRSAHVVPVEEDDWFHANQMSQYVFDIQRRSRSAISDVNNLMLLRSDLHTSFDSAKKFVFVPKRPQPNLSNMVTHLLSPSDEYGPLYHNTAAYSLDLIPRQYLLARFAWAIFPLVEPFLLSEVRRSLATAAKAQHTFEPDDCKDFTVSRCKRSGTGSPKKRPRQATASEENVQHGEPTKRARLLSSEPVSPQTEPALPACFSSSSTKVNGPSVPSNATPATTDFGALVSKDSHPCPATSEVQASALNDGSFDWVHFCSLRERGLQNERQKSDPDGDWLEEFSWAMEVLKNEHSATDTQAWADVDEARRILGEVDESRDWVKYEDRFRYWGHNHT